MTARRAITPGEVGGAPALPPYLTKRQLANALSVSESTVDELVADQTLPLPIASESGPLWDWAEVDARLQAIGEKGRIYVVGFGEYIKIGHTRHPIVFRLASLQTACPERLIVYASLVGSAADEAALLRRFAHANTQGEWFRRDAIIDEWIATGCPL